MSFARLVPFGWDDRARGAYAAITGTATVPGRVVRVDRISCVVAVPEGERIARFVDLPAVGDWVALTEDPDDAQLVIEAIGTRWSALTRHDADRERVQVLAANVDVVMIAAPGDRPSPARVERETVLGWESGARPLVIVTKADLVLPGYVEELRARLVGVEVITTSAATGVGVEAVVAALAPCRTAVMLGPSGAGKSTLINALLGEERLMTGSVRDDDRRGRHTTSSRELVVIPTGGVLIDTPGVRTLGLGSVEDGLDAAFADIVALAAQCRFADCAHEGEPGCAVQAAVAADELDPARLENYRHLESEIVGDGRVVDHAAAKAKREDEKRIQRAARQARRQ